MPMTSRPTTFSSPRQYRPLFWRVEDTETTSLLADNHLPLSTAALVDTVVPFFPPSTAPSWKEMEVAHGLPWKQPEASTSSRLFSMGTWQSNLFQSQLTDFVPTEEYAVFSDDHNTSRMLTLCGRSHEYRRIRTTYLESPHAHIYSSVCYPCDPTLPILAMDLMCFGKKILCICDVQPICDDNTESSLLLDSRLKSIRDRVPVMQGSMKRPGFGAKNDKESSYFSNQMLLGKFNDTSFTKEMLEQTVQPTIQAYVKEHVSMIQQSQRKAGHHQSLSQKATLLQRHGDYDTAMSQHGPTLGLLSSLFGPEEADRILYQVLFPLATKPKETKGQPAR